MCLHKLTFGELLLLVPAAGCESGSTLGREARPDAVIGLSRTHVCAVTTSAVSLHSAGAPPAAAMVLVRLVQLVLVLAIVRLSGTRKYPQCLVQCFVQAVYMGYVMSSKPSFA